MNRVRVMLIATWFMALVVPGVADEWNDRTILKFSAPVTVPGATLPPGSYVFELTDANASRNVVSIRNEATNEVVALTQAVPIKRTDPGGDIVVQFNPAERGAPPALKAWFFPGSLYGHEFVYPDDQARLIADRAKTVVLSTDVPGTDLEKGVLRVYDPAGTRADWRGDAATLREWDTWQRARGTRTQRGAQASAPAVSTAFQGTRVRLNDLEENPSRYLGQRISVDAEVEEIYGPRLFTIDEPHWGDLSGEILVLLPTAAAALVKDNDRVTISGTLRPFTRTEIEREWGWLGLDPQIELDVSAKPVLVADRLVGGDNNVAMVIDVTAPAKPVGTTGGSNVITDANTLATATAGMIGREVRLSGVRVSGTAAGGGFFVTAGNGMVFVLPAQATTISTGDSATITGVLLQMPRSMVTRLDAPPGLNRSVYIYAAAVSR